MSFSLTLKTILTINTILMLGNAAADFKDGDYLFMSVALLGALFSFMSLHFEMNKATR